MDGWGQVAGLMVCSQWAGVDPSLGALEIVIDARYVCMCCV